MDNKPVEEKRPEETKVKSTIKKVLTKKQSKNVEIENLKKYYGEVKAVDGISFTVEKGEFFAFLGVNGAGKSTTISILCGDQKRTDGSVKVTGKDVDDAPAEIRRKLGVVFQNSALDRSLSVRDNLKYRAALYGVTGKAFEARLAELSALFELKDLLNVPWGSFRAVSGEERTLPARSSTAPKFSF